MERTWKMKGNLDDDGDHDGIYKVFLLAYKEGSGRKSTDHHKWACSIGFWGGSTPHPKP